MGKMLWRAAVGLAMFSWLASVAVAADLQPLNVKTGVWQVSTTTTIEGMATPMTQTYQSCVTNENLKEYPFPDRHDECTYSVQSSTSSHMEVSGSCIYREGGKADFKLRLDVVDSENVQGSGQANIDTPQGTMHGQYSGKGKWVGSSCPAGLK